MLNNSRLSNMKGTKNWKTGWLGSVSAVVRFLALEILFDVYLYYLLTLLIPAEIN